jgi:hypothetical protein
VLQKNGIDVTSCLQYEMALTAEIDENFTEDLTLDGDSAPLLGAITTDDDDEENYCELEETKRVLQQELSELNDLIQMQHAHLLDLESDVLQRQVVLQEETDHMEKQRDELSLQVSQLQTELDQLATERTSAIELNAQAVRSNASFQPELVLEQKRRRELESRCLLLEEELQKWKEHSDATPGNTEQRDEDPTHRRCDPSLAVACTDPEDTVPSPAPSGSSKGRSRKDPADSPSQLEVTPTSAQADQIRIRAVQMISLADFALERARGNRSACSSVASSLGTDFRPSLGVSVISNINHVETTLGCSCESSLFSGNLEYADFYLPAISVDCSCGKVKNSSVFSESDPSELCCILRPWQVRFLASLKIHNTIDFLHACKERIRELAKHMRRWRRVQGMLSVKTKSCNVALYIWSRTCRAVLRSVSLQRANGVTRPVRPSFLELANAAADAQSSSTLGWGSYV